MTQVKGQLLIRRPGFQHVAGETHAFTKKRKKNAVNRKIQRASRAKNRKM